MTPEQLALAQRSKLDQRCRACGAGSAASSRCYRCGSHDLDYTSHAGQTGGAYLCGGSNRNGRRPSRAAATDRTPAGPEDVAEVISL